MTNKFRYVIDFFIITKHASHITDKEILKTISIFLLTSLLIDRNEIKEGLKI